MPKKRHLGSQNGSGSSGPEKLLKIVIYAETEKLKETMVGGHQYPPGSNIDTFTFRSNYTDTFTT